VLGDLLYEAVAQRRQAATAAAAAGVGGEWGSQQSQERVQDGGAGSQAAAQPAAQPASGPFMVGDDAAEWSRAAQADPLRPIGLQAWTLQVHDPQGMMGAEGGGADGWVEFAAGTPWWRA